MLQRMLCSIRSRISSDTEDPGLAVDMGRRYDSRDAAVAEKKVLPLVLGNNTNKALLFCGLAL